MKKLLLTLLLSLNASACLTPFCSGGSSGGGGGVSAMGTFGSSPNVNGGTISGSTLTLQPADGSNPGGLTASTQTLGGVKTFSSAPIFSALSVSTVPYLDGSKSLTSSAVTPTELGYVSGVTSAIQTQLNAKQATVSFGAFGSSPNSNGGGISAGTITLQPADGSNPGGVSTTTQVFAGIKSFTGNITKINNVTTSFPSSQGGAGSRFENDGSGNFSWKKTGQAVVVALTDGSTPALDASLGTVFTLVTTQNPTIAIPSNPTSGQKIVISINASGGSRTAALNTSAGGFRFGSDITTLTQTASGKTDYIGAIYNSTAGFWDVVAYTKGF